MNISKIAAAVALGALAIGGAQAEGGDQYPNRAETWLAGAVPPPATISSTTSAITVENWRRQWQKAPSGEVDAWFNAFRFVHTSEHKILGGNWGWHVIVPLVPQKVDLFGSQVGEWCRRHHDRSVHRLRHSKNWHWAIGLDINLPVGRQGRRCAPEHRRQLLELRAVVCLLLWATPAGKVSAKVMYNIKTKNRTTPVRPGAGITVGRRVSHGLSRRNVSTSHGRGPVRLLPEADHGRRDQWSDDCRKCVLVRGDARGEVFAIGPTVSYTTKGGVHFTGQWNHETRAENRFEGDKFILKLIMPL